MICTYIYVCMCVHTVCVVCIHAFETISIYIYTCLSLGKKSGSAKGARCLRNISSIKAIWARSSSSCSSFFLTTNTARPVHDFFTFSYHFSFAQTKNSKTTPPPTLSTPGPSQTIICQRCTFANAPDVANCTMCGAILPSCMQCMRQKGTCPVCLENFIRDDNGCSSPSFPSYVAAPLPSAPPLPPPPPSFNISAPPSEIMGLKASKEHPIQRSRSVMITERLRSAEEELRAQMALIDEMFLKHRAPFADPDFFPSDRHVYIYIYILIVSNACIHTTHTVCTHIHTHIYMYISY